MTETGYRPYFYKGLSYNRSREIISQRGRENNGLVIPGFERKMPYQYKSYSEMVQTGDNYCRKSPYPNSRKETTIPTIWGRWAQRPFFDGGDFSNLPITEEVVAGEFTLVATASSDGGYSGVWSDTFTGTDNDPVDSTKWEQGFGTSKISSNQLYMLTESHATWYQCASLISKAPSTSWETFAASIQSTDFHDGFGIGWYDENLKVWGIIQGFMGGGWNFITPGGVTSSPDFTGFESTMAVRVVSTGGTASGYYRTSDADTWHLISSVAGAPATPVHIGFGGGSSPSWRGEDNFKIDFSGAGTPSVDLVWTGTAAHFRLYRNGAMIYSGRNKSYTDTAVTTATTYTYTLYAYDRNYRKIGEATDTVTTE